MQIAEYINKVESWLRRYLEPKQEAPTTQRVSIYVSDKTVSLLHLDFTTTGVELLFDETRTYDNAQNLQMILSNLVTKQNLNHVPAYLTLTPLDYQLFVLESLPVKSEEMQEAINWRIRSLVKYPPSEITLDYFLLPPKPQSPNNPMIAAIAAHTPLLQKKITLLQNNGFKLTHINIPELALRNLILDHDTDDQCTAFLYFYEKMVLLNITYEKTIYFTRHIALITEPDNVRKSNQELGLDLLRFFDYLQSQWRRASLGRIFIATESGDPTEIVKALSPLLFAPIQPFVLSSGLKDKSKLPSIEKNYLLPFGSVIEQEETHVETAH